MMSHMQTRKGPATIMVKKKQQWQNSAAMSARTVYVDDSQGVIGQQYSAHMTGNKFNETLPLITDFESHSGQDQSVQALKLKSTIKEEVIQSSIQGSALATTFEDYRHNLQSGSMKIISELQYQQQLANQSKLSHSINQTNEQTSKNESTMQSIKSAMKPFQQQQQQQTQQPIHTNTSSKGILPVLNRSPSPSHEGPIDFFQEQRIQQSLDFSRFQGYDLAQKRGLLGDGLITKRKVTLRDQLLKDVAASVTLKDGWRKVLLPTLDLRTKHNSTEVSARVSPENNHHDKSGCINNASRLEKPAKYESSKIKTVVNEGNVLGRQSVENLLQIYTPGISSAHQDCKNLEPQLLQPFSTENKRSPFLSPFTSQSPKSQLATANHYKIMIETSQKDTPAHYVNLSQQEFSAVRSSLQKQGIGRNASKHINLRNSEAHSFMRSQPRPIKRVLLHRDLNPDSPLGELAPSSVFTKKKILNRSISPNNYDNGLGYAPRTIRLFNLKKEKPLGTTTNIAGKVQHNENIFSSMAVGGGAPSLNVGRNVARYKQYTTIDHSSLPRHNQTREEKIKSSLSIASHRSSQISIGRWSETVGEQNQKPKERSRLQQYQQQQHLTLQVENQKDWAPTEMLSRSQLYSQRQLVEAPDMSTIIVKGGYAVQNQPPSASLPYSQTSHDPSNKQTVTTELHPKVLIAVPNMPQEKDLSNVGVPRLRPQQLQVIEQQKRQQRQQMQQNLTQQFIKVSNHGMMLDNKSMSSSVESHSSALKFMAHISEWPDPLSQSLMQEHLKNAMLPEYDGEMPKTSAGKQLSSQQEKSDGNAERILYLQTAVSGDAVESELLMANQATQVLTEENFEKISLQNDEEWSEEVKQIMQLQMVKRSQAQQQQASRQIAIDEQTGLINAISVPQVLPSDLRTKSNAMGQLLSSIGKVIVPEMRKVKEEIPMPQPPPMSSASTMHLYTVSNLKRQTGQQSFKGDDLPQAQVTNTDLQTVMANKTHMVLLKGDLDKPITLTDFKKLQYNLAPGHPPFAASPAINNAQFRKGIVIKGDMPNNTHESFHLKARDSQVGSTKGGNEAKTMSGPIPQALSELEALPRGFDMHPDLVSALQNSKHLKIRSPIRKQTKNRQLANVLIPKVIAESNVTLPKQSDSQGMFQIPTGTANKEDFDNEKGTLCMTMKSSLFQLHTVNLSERDTEIKPSKVAVHSLLEQTDRTSGFNSNLKNSRLRFQEEINAVSPPPRLMNPRHANIVILPNQGQVSNIGEQANSSPTLIPAFQKHGSPHSMSKVMKNAANSPKQPASPVSPMKEQDQLLDNQLRLANPSSVYLGTSMNLMPTMREIPPINIEFSLEKPRDPQPSPLAIAQLNNSIKLSPSQSKNFKKISLLKQSSTQSIKTKDRPTKKVNFSKKVLLPLQQLIKGRPVDDQVNPMNIQKMVQSNRYDLPRIKSTEFEKNFNQDIEVKRMSQLEVKMAPEDSLQNSRESIHNRTQLLLNSCEGNRDMSTQEKYTTSRNKQKSQLDLQTIKMENPELLVMNSFRRTQEKFTQKLQSKMMNVKPIKARQHTSNKQSPGSSPQPDHEAFKFAKNQASISTFKAFNDPSDQQPPQHSIQIANQTSSTGMRVSVQKNKESSGPTVTKVARKTNRPHISNQMIVDKGALGSRSRNCLSKHSKQQLSGDLNHVANGGMNQKGPHIESEVQIGKNNSTRLQHQLSNKFAPIQSNKSCQQAGESFAQLICMTGHTGSSPQSPHCSSPLMTSVEGRMDATMEKTWGPRDDKIIVSPDGLCGTTANLPIATPVNTAELLQISSEDKHVPMTPRTPSSGEHVKQLLQMADQINITPAPYGFSSRGSGDKSN